MPITQFMSSKAASSSSSDKPGLLMSCGLHSSPSVRDASVETPNSSASIKETAEKQSKTGLLVTQSKKSSDFLETKT